MCISIALAAIGAVASVKQAMDSREAAKEQAARMEEESKRAAAQAAEAARANTLAQQTAIERQKAQDAAKANQEKANVTVATPDVQVTAGANPVENKRRKQVRAQFSTAETGVAGPIRL